MSRSIAAAAMICAALLLGACTWQPTGLDAAEGHLGLHFAVTEPAQGPSRLRVEVMGYYSALLDCLQVEDDFAVTFNARAATILSRGGLGEFTCIPARAEIELTPEDLQGPATLVASDSTTTVTVDAWTALPRRVGRLAAPADGHLILGEPVRIDWPYPYQDYRFDLALSAYGDELTTPTVQDGQISATYQHAHDDFYDRLMLTARRPLLATCTGASCSGEQTTITALPITTDPCSTESCP